MDFNQEWSFHLGELLDGHLMCGSEAEFKAVTIPHDYSIEQPYDKEQGDGCTGYLLGGMGWYRKAFCATPEMKSGKVFLCFDGIYNRANIYLNEQFIAFHPYGYSPLLLDITEYLQDDNLLAVQVDHTRYADSRWYTGSGIYRKVSLHTCPKTYLPVWGTKVSTVDVSAAKATVNIAVDCKNEAAAMVTDAQLTTKIYAPDGTFVAEQSTQFAPIAPNEQVMMAQAFAIETPVLWGIYEGNLYQVHIALTIGGVCVQEKQVAFGIRDFRFDPDEGFFLNGKSEKIKGVCLHHDAGLVGAAVPKDVWRKRLQTLIEGGCNAIRTAHNPASEDFLDLCDTLGLLVQEEFYDEWDNPKDKRYNMNEQKVDYITRGHHEFFQEYAEQDLKAVIHRDYNHPCIFQWSIGNEIEWTYPKYNTATGYFSAEASGNYFWQEPPYSVAQIRENVSKLPRERYEIGDTAAKLARWTKEVDTTRPVVANCILPSASYESGYTDALDLVGFSYRQVVYERSHQNYPQKPIMGTENLAQWHEWKQVLEKQYISGIFLWTGIDYLGESGNRDVWPCKATASGLLDVAGYPKGSYHMFKALWTEQPCLHMVTQTLEASLYQLDADGALQDKEGKGWANRLWVWQSVNEHWNYAAQQAVVVEVYSNCDAVTLYLNDVALSTQRLEDFPDRIYKWHLPFASGTLVAVGAKDGETIRTVLRSAAQATMVRLSADKTQVNCNGDEVVHIDATLLDASGTPVRWQDAEIVFSVQGDGARVYGVDNGANNFVGAHQSCEIQTHNGRALLLLGGVKSGQVMVSATLQGSTSNEITIQVI